MLVLRQFGMLRSFDFVSQHPAASTLVKGSHRELPVRLQAGSRATATSLHPLTYQQCVRQSDKLRLLSDQQGFDFQSCEPRCYISSPYQRALEANHHEFDPYEFGEAYRSYSNCYFLTEGARQEETSENLEGEAGEEDEEVEDEDNIRDEEVE